MNKSLRSAILLAGFLLLLISSCKHSDDLQPVSPNPPVVPVDDATQVIANVSGIVLDENNVPVAGASVSSNTATATTNAFGMFYLGNISLSKNNGSVTVTKTGYYKGVRSFKTTAGKNHSVKIQLMQKILSGTLNAASGGNINSNGGAVINFPAGAFVTSTGAAYSGTVNVYSRWIDPTAKNLPYIIPGDLRGVGTNNAESILITYGMVGAEIEDASGNPLSIAPGKTAGISFPIPAALSATAPATIALWHFDNAAARWREEGVAVRSGNNYTAQVNKFSFWNCDEANSDFIVLDFTLINSANGMPLVNTAVRIRVASGNASANGVTNGSGFVSGLVPKNELLVLEVIAGDCTTPLYSQNIGPFSGNTSLGNINVNLQGSMFINFTGKIVNCSAAPVTNGYISLSGSGGNNAFANTDASGNFSFTILNCTGSNLSYSYLAFDNTTSQQSSIISGTATTSTVNLGTITACSTVVTGTDIYIAGYELPTTPTQNNIAKLWKNGVATSLTDGTKNGRANSVYVLGNNVYVCGIEQDMATNFSFARVWKNGVATNLTSGNNYAEANGVFAVGTDVFVTGREGAIAKVWKNGVATSLNNPGNSANGSAIFVSGTDVYVAGSIGGNGTVWKNGSILFMSGSSHYNSIAVVGTDVYVSGTGNYGMKNIAVTWKNGTPTDLSNGAADAMANAIAVSGTDVYAVGEEKNISDNFWVAKLWKNGVVTNLTNGLNYGGASAVKLLGTDVYVCGHDNNAAGNQVVTLWKNGFPVIISDVTRNAFGGALFVK